MVVPWTDAPGGCDFSVCERLYKFQERLARRVVALIKLQIHRDLFKKVLNSRLVH